MPAEDATAPAAASHEARRLADEGAWHLKAGSFDDAIASFADSYALVPAPGLLYNLGQAHRLKGDCREALSRYRAYLATGITGELRRRTDNHIAGMEACLSKAKVQIPDAPPAKEESPIPPPGAPSASVIPRIVTPVVEPPVRTSHAKGDVPFVTAHRNEDIVSDVSPDFGVFAAFGQTVGVGRELNRVFAARLGLRPTATSGFVLNLDGAVGVADTFREYRTLLLAGYRSGIASGPWAFFAGAHLGGGIIAQRAAMASGVATPIGGLLWSAGISWRAARQLALALETDVMVCGYKRDGHVVGSIWPAVYLGAVIFR